MTMLNTCQRSSLAPRRSPARMRWPVLEIGRNSVRPSTTPRIRATRRSLIQKGVDASPVKRVSVDGVVAGFFQRDPALRSRPCGVEKLRMLGRDDAIAHRHQAEERDAERRRTRDGIEAVLEHPRDRQERVMV